MGIKFRCPNGHKLHVKSFLAGKKGVCPKCGIKVDVPAATNLDELEDAPTPPGGMQLGPSPAASLFPIPAPPPGAPAPYAPAPQAYSAPQAYAPPPDPFGLPAAALPQPAAPYAAGGRTYARPIPIPMPAPAAFPVPAAPVPTVARPVPLAPIAAPQDDPFAGLLPAAGESQWNPNMPLAAPSAPVAHQLPIGPAKRGGLNLGRNGTLLLVFVALILVGALIWGMIAASSGTPAKPSPEPAKTQSSLSAPLDSSRGAVL